MATLLEWVWAQIIDICMWIVGRGQRDMLYQIHWNRHPLHRRLTFMSSIWPHWNKSATCCDHTKHTHQTPSASSSFWMFVIIMLLGNWMMSPIWFAIDEIIYEYSNFAVVPRIYMRIRGIDTMAFAWPNINILTLWTVLPLTHVIRKC